MAFSDMIQVAALTDVGRIRNNNEDSYGSFPDVGVFCVADGMGGGDDGEVASTATVQAVARIVSDLTPPSGCAFALEHVADALAGAVNEASGWICRRSKDRCLSSCGSTFVGLCLDAAHPQRAMALHAGDSRLYRIRGGGIQQLTADHSVAGMLGARDETEVNPMFRSMILRAVGVAPEVELARTPVDVAEGDRFLLCSDGLSRMVSDERILSVCQSNGNSEEAAQLLVAEANRAGGLDNITVIVIDVGTLPDPLWVVDGPRVTNHDDAFFGETRPEAPEEDVVACSRIVRWSRLMHTIKRQFGTRRGSDL